VPTRAPLIRAHHRAALDERLPDRKPRKASAKPKLPPTCHLCGKPLTNGRRPHCESCRRQRWIEQAARSRRIVANLNIELRDGLAEQLHAALADSPTEMTRTQIQRLLSRNVPGDRIQSALDQLATSRVERFDSESRPAVVPPSDGSRCKRPRQGSEPIIDSPGGEQEKRYES